jgi:hypothetical protein
MIVQWEARNLKDLKVVLESVLGLLEEHRMVVLLDEVSACDGNVKSFRFLFDAILMRVWRDYYCESDHRMPLAVVSIDLISCYLPAMAMLASSSDEEWKWLWLLGLS